MHSESKGPRRNNIALQNDPLVQQVTMMALMSNPAIEKRLEETILMIDGIMNTVRTLRRGMEFFNNSMREAQRHMLSLPTGAPFQQTNGSPYNNNGSNSNGILNGVNTKPVTDDKEDAQPST